MLKFPKSFKFGAAISAMQTEGKGTTKIGKLTFDELFEIQPEKFHNGIGPSITSDIMNHYKSDIKMMKEMKLESLRTGFSWARLFPDGKTLNKEAVKYYHNFIDELIKNDVQVFMTLFHFDMPMWAQKKVLEHQEKLLKVLQTIQNLFLKNIKKKLNFMLLLMNR